MDKIRLINGDEFTLAPDGVNIKDKTRVFKIVTEKTHDEIVNSFSNANNIARIEYVQPDGTIAAIYEDCVTFKTSQYVPKMQIDDNNVSDVYIITVSIDAIEKMMSELSSGLTYAELALIEVYELFLGVI